MNRTSLCIRCGRSSCRCRRKRPTVLGDRALERCRRLANLADLLLQHAEGNTLPPKEVLRKLRAEWMKHQDWLRGK